MNEQNARMIDDETLEQLIDGQLNSRRYREVVQQLDRTPDGWRRCALAFLEEQALSREMRALAAGGMTSPTLRLPNFQENHGDSLDCKQAIAPARAIDSMQRFARRINLMALAASTLLAFGLGWIGAGATFSPTNSMQWNSDRGILNTPVQMGTTDTNWSTFDPSQFQPGELVPVDRQVPAFLADLERRGMVQIETLDGLFPIELDDGRQAIVPVQNFRVRPVFYAY